MNVNKNTTSCDKYKSEIDARVQAEALDHGLSKLKRDLHDQMNWNRYAYNFTWFGRPVIQVPQDTVTFQEIIWEVKPDLIIETGVAHGGSLVFSASMLALLEKFELVENPLVVGVDIEIRPHNREAIEKHPASRWIELLEGSSIDPMIVEKVKEKSHSKKRVMLFLDSNHTHNHVLAELRLLAPLVTVGSYVVVLDTGIEDIDPAAIVPGKPWCRGNSPKSALKKYLAEAGNFEVDTYYHEKAWVSSAPGGFLRKIRY